MTSSSVGLGPWIKRRRDELGITQDELAELVGAPRAYISQIETGNKKWPRSYIEKLADALSVPVEALEIAAGRTRPDTSRSEQAVSLLAQLATPDELRIITAIFARAAEVTPGHSEDERKRWRSIVEEMQASGDFNVDDFLDRDRLRFTLPLSAEGSGSFIYEANFSPTTALDDEVSQEGTVNPER